MERKLSKICTSCLQYIYLFAATVPLSASVLSIPKANAATLQSKTKPTDISISEYSDLSTIEDRKIVSSSATPVFVIDGDSLEIGSRRIRLTGIDAPEYDQFCKKKDSTLYPCGKIATDYLKTLTSEKDVSCRIDRQDKYKRYLCTCTAENIELNAEMIQSGNAVIYLEDTYVKQEMKARKNRKGIWSGTFMHPRLFRLMKYHQKKQNQEN